MLPTSMEPLTTLQEKLNVMAALAFVGFLAVMTGFSLLILGGETGSKASISHREKPIVGQAWFMVLVLGFLIMALDAYMAS